MQCNTAQVPEDTLISSAAQESGTQYQYVPLGGHRSEIRLISLEPATTWAEPIRCKILHVEVDDADYQALSSGPGI
jgi:hypothetical protein